MLVTNYSFGIFAHDHDSEGMYLYVQVYMALCKIYIMPKSCCVPGHTFSTRTNRSQGFTLSNPKTEPERKYSDFKPSDVRTPQANSGTLLHHTPSVMCVANAS